MFQSPSTALSHARQQRTALHPHTSCCLLLLAASESKSDSDPGRTSMRAFALGAHLVAHGHQRVEVKAHTNVTRDGRHSPGP